MQKKKTSKKKKASRKKGKGSMSESHEKRKALGRGLEALLPGRTSAATTATPPPAGPVAAAGTRMPVAAEAGEAVRGEAVREIPIEEIERNPYQTRTRMDEAALAEVAA